MSPARCSTSSQSSCLRLTRHPGRAATSQHPARGSGLLGPAAPVLEPMGRSPRHRRAGHGRELAPSRVSHLLELAVQAGNALRPSSHASRGPSAHPEDGIRAPLGCPSPSLYRSPPARPGANRFTKSNCDSTSTAPGLTLRTIRIASAGGRRCNEAACGDGSAPPPAGEAVDHHRFTPGHPLDDAVHEGSRFL